MVCPSCKSESHQRSSSRLCSNYQPRESKRPPVEGARQTHMRVYKTGFNSFVKPEYLPIISSKMNEIVSAMTQICFETTQLLHLYVANKIAAVELIPEELLEENFIRQFFATIISNGSPNKADEDILITYREIYVPCRDAGYTPPSIHNFGQVVTYFARNYSTILKTHIKQHVNKFFSSKLLGIFIDQFKWDKPTSHRRCDAILVSEVEDEFYKKHPDLLIWRHQLDEINRTVHSRLLYCYQRNTENSTFNETCGEGQKQRKLFHLIPLFSMTAKYITIDSDVLHDMLGKTFFDGANRKTAGKNQLHYWAKFFDIPERLLNKSMFKRTFAFLIETDGVGVSVLTSRWFPKDEEIAACQTKEERREVYEKRAKRQQEKELQNIGRIANRTDTKWVGTDPGRISILTAYHESGYDDFGSHLTTNVKQLSKNRYYTESQFRHRTRKSKVYTKGYDLTNYIAQMPSTKCGTPEGILTYLTYIYSGNKFRDWIRMHCTRRYRKLRWRAYIHNQKSVLRFCRESLGSREDIKNTIICMGDAKFGHNAKGNETTPTNKRFVKGYRKIGAHPFMTNEFNTSQVCSNCLTGIKLAICNSASKQHGVRKCTLETCRTTWNRDVNAAHNMIISGKSQIRLGRRVAPYEETLPSSTVTTVAPSGLTSVQGVENTVQTLFS